MPDPLTGEVAIVDDDPAVLDSFRFMLEAAGLAVGTYGSGAAFLEHGVRRSKCLILDHHMPHMTGLQLAARLRKDQVSMPIMLVTAAPTAAIVARAAELGIEKVLEKPPTLDEVMKFVGVDS